MNYECIICLDLAAKPVSCLRCHKLLCFRHIRLLNHKCPNCRLQPFQYQREPMIESFIGIEIHKRKQKMKRQAVFKCLSEGCGFQGKYHSMEIHRKSRHPSQNIDELIFPEDRQQKLKRDALKRFFFDKFKQNTEVYREKALKIYVSSKGRCDINVLIKMIAHIENCQNPECNNVFVGQQYAFIGRKNEEELEESKCFMAQAMKQKL